MKCDHPAVAGQASGQGCRKGGRGANSTLQIFADQLTLYLFISLLDDNFVRKFGMMSQSFGMKMIFLIFVKIILKQIKN